MSDSETVEPAELPVGNGSLAGDTLFDDEQWLGIFKEECWL